MKNLLWSLFLIIGLTTFAAEEKQYLEIGKTEDLEQFDQLYNQKLGEYTQQNHEIQKKLEQIDAIKQQIEKLKNFFTDFKALKNLEVALPMGYTQGKGDGEFAIMLKPTDPIFGLPTETQQAKAIPTHYDIYISIPYTTTVDSKKINQRIAFELLGAPAYGTSGFTLKGGTLNLVAPVLIPLGNGLNLGLKKGSKASFDCKGLKNFKAKFELIFPKSYVVVEDTTLNGKTLLNPQFEVEFASFDDFTAEIQLNKSFYHTDLKDVIFSVENIVLDNSTNKTPSLFKFPEGYTDNREGWTGVYISRAELHVHKKLRGKTPPLKIGVDKIIIDKNGFTGAVAVDNMAERESIKPKSWDINLQRLGFKMYKNQLEYFTLGGSMALEPFDSVIDYEGSLDFANNEYLFSATMPESFQFDVFQAKLDIYSSSRIELKFTNETLIPSLYLNGQLSIDAAIGGGKNFQVPNISFEQMLISADAPYFKPGEFGLSGGGKIGYGDFPISISNINSFEEGVRFDVNLNLSTQFAGTAGIKLYGNFEKWEFDRVWLDKVAVDVDMSPSFTMKGMVMTLEDDPVYGSGFRGQLALNVSQLFDMEAMVVFGNVDRYRYFMTDANLTLPTPVYVGPVGFTTFGGGLYYHMKQSSKPSNSEFGRTLSGVSYEPNKSVGLGVMARTRFNIAEDAVAMGQLGMEIQFNNNWGLNFIDFQGEFQTIPYEFPSLKELEIADMKALSEGNPEVTTPTQTSALITATMGMRMDFENETFLANYTMNMGVPGIVEGKGWGELYVSPKDWHLMVGKPDRRNEVNFAGFAKFDNYFMMGTDIPDIPPPNAKAAQLSGLKIKENRDLAVLESGKGLAFGAGFEAGGSFDFLAFYAKFGFGIGFDLMLKNYGSDAMCEGISGPIGIEGWYAQGQAWAYVEGDIGIRVNLFGSKKSVSILDIGAGAVLQAKGPNPFWMQGNVGGRYSVMGGLVSGKVAFEFELGEQCKIIQTNPFGFDVIADITPYDESEEVDVFTSPQVIFNVPVNQEIKMIDDDGRRQYYRIKLNSIAINELNEDGSVKSTVSNIKESTAEDHKAITLNPDDPFESTTNYEMVATITFQKKENQKWVDQKGTGGKIAQEVKSVKFTSGVRPKTINWENVAYSYPMEKQFNYYKNEHPKGYFKLNENYSYLFEENAQFKQVLRITDRKGQHPREHTLSYTKGENYIEFDMPQDLENNKVHLLSLVSVPKQKQEGDFDNVSQESTQAEGMSGDNSMTITTQKAEGTLTQLEETNIISNFFRTSHYNSFKEKIGGLLIGIQASPWNVNAMVENLLVSCKDKKGEGFDQVEAKLLIGTTMNAKADYENTKWFQDQISYPVYSENLWAKARLSRPEVPQDVLEIPKLINHGQIDEEGYVEKNNKPVLGAFRYVALKEINDDYNELRSAIINKYVDIMSNKKTSNADLKDVEDLANYTLPLYSRGKYPVDFNYFLPGQKQINSSYTITFNYN